MAWSESAYGQQPWQSWARVVDLCQCQEDHVDALRDELDNLTEAFELGEIPVPRTSHNVERLEAYLGELRERLENARRARDRCRDANPLP
jgi:hypothetical protein